MPLLWDRNLRSPADNYMLKVQLTDTQKVKAIHYLLEECSRHDEWCESNLLHKIEELINNEVDDAPATLQKLITEAEHN